MNHDPDKDGLRAAFDIQTAAAERLRREPAWVVTEMDSLVCHASKRQTLQRVIGDQVEEFVAGVDGDRVIWRGNRIAATIRTLANGGVQVIRYDLEGG
ncbi:hypothetical protein [Singulisphaera sp. PoT]|uniref:hypothetical protein n=1 Tax=Singulisphaera sp. PoT TaxID=3411797 RepID=UPI003BF5B6FB